MEKNVVSVIIPVYNCASFLERCVNSVLRQSYPTLEVILIDDGSSDESGKICDEFAQKNRNCNVIHQESKGPSAARNRGLECASGEYICFVDADDYIEKNMLTRVVAELHAGAEICSFGARRVDEKERYLYEMRFDAGIGTYDFEKGNRQQFILNRFMRYQVGWEVWLQVYRREFLEKYSLRFDETIHYGEDKIFTAQCMAYVREYRKIPDILYNYTLRSGSLTGNFLQKEMIDRGNTEYLCLREKWKRSGIINEENDYLFYIGILYYYYTILLKTMSLKELAECVGCAEKQTLQREFFRKIQQHKEEIYRAFDKGTGADIMRMVSVLIRD